MGLGCAVSLPLDRLDSLSKKYPTLPSRPPRPPSPVCSYLLSPLDHLPSPDPQCDSPVSDGEVLSVPVCGNRLCVPRKYVYEKRGCVPVHSSDTSGRILLLHKHMPASLVRFVSLYHTQVVDHKIQTVTSTEHRVFSEKGVLLGVFSDLKVARLLSLCARIDPRIQRCGGREWIVKMLKGEEAAMQWIRCVSSDCVAPE